MAEFFLGNSVRKAARKHSVLRRALWRLDFALIWLLTTALRLLPTDAASRTGARIGRFIGPYMKAKHERMKDNLRVVFPEHSDAELETLARSTWAHGGRILAEYMHLDSILGDNDGKRIQIEIEQPFRTLEDPTKPVVIVTAHQSNWEVVCSAMARLNMPNASIYTPPTNPYLDKLLLDSRAALRCTLLPRDQSARLLLRALRNGNTAAMVMDRRVNEGAEIEFFGRLKPSTLLPAKLALKQNCDIIPVRVERLQDANFKVTFMKPVIASNPDASENDRAIDIIQQVHGHFEAWIKACPGEWFCSKRIWPKAKPRAVQLTKTQKNVKSYAA